MPGLRMNYTALIRSAWHPDYYTVQLESVAVNGQVLPVTAVRHAPCFMHGRQADGR